MIEPLRRRLSGAFTTVLLAGVLLAVSNAALAQSFVSTGVTLDDMRILAAAVGATPENIVVKAVTVDQVIREASPDVAPLPESPSYPDGFRTFVAEANRGGRVVKFLDTYVKLPGRPAGAEFGYAVIRDGQAVAVLAHMKRLSSEPN